MKISIAFDSITGNTEKLAQEISKACKYNDVISYGDTTQDVSKADVIFAGSYTENKDFSGKMKTFLKSLKNQKIFLFGTCGFGNGKEYYNEILNNVKKHISSSNEIIGSFICQGEVEQETKDKFLKDVRRNKKVSEVKKYINNIELAEKHPNEDDLFALDETLRRV